MPEVFESSTPSKVENKKRGKLLTCWLIIMLIANIGTSLTYLLWNSTVITSFSNIPVWIFYIYGILALANAAFTVFLFRWKKWAFFAFCGSAIIASVLNLLIGIETLSIIAGLTGPIILYLILRSRWNLFE